MNKQNKHNKNMFRPCVNVSRETYNKISRIVDSISTVQNISTDEYIDAVLDRHLKEHCRQTAKKKYRLRFLKKVGIVARLGKLVYVRREYHDRILKIIQVIGKNEISIASYIDNVLEHHFATYQAEITDLYNEHDRSIF